MKSRVRFSRPKTMQQKSFARLIFITIGIFVLMSALRPESFLTGRNMTSMAFQFPEMGLLTLAITLAFLTGGMDLSLVGISNLTGIIAGFIMTAFAAKDLTGAMTGVSIGAAIAASVAAGAMCGAINAILISKLKVTPMLATLGTMQLFTGMALVCTRGTAVVGFPEQFSVIGQGLLWVAPIPLLIFLTAAIGLNFSLKRTKMGLSMHYVGENEKAANYAGIPVTKTIMQSYMIGGVLAAVAGIIMMSRVNSAKADFGSSYTMQTILIAVLGGVSPSGGKAEILEVVIAVLSLQFLSSGFNMLRFSQYAKELVWGVLLIAVIAISILHDGKERN